MNDLVGTPIEMDSKVAILRPGGGAAVGQVVEFLDRTIVVLLSGEVDSNLKLKASNWGREMFRSNHLLVLK